MKTTTANGCFRWWRGEDSIDFVVVVFHFPTLIRFGLVQCYRLSQVFVRETGFVR